ncbi:putative mismatched base pair and cruciform DNA recognition protein [Penicillium brasilianum]|uniref:Putative mismatched base pair and cruciform DNA recognition protein n=1 Tax=Penicillium brasilianum TaxID=104259 RepID=A0A1S9RG55_PENBI|nr:putative mismatched base pair and cruciform DNA recognition protein [Penicillium brasilianum]
MSDNNSSTLGSYVNQATGMAQRAFGAVTGDSSTQVRNTSHYPSHIPTPTPDLKTNFHQAKGELSQEQGEIQNANSHTTAKVGNLTADPNTGAVAKDNSKRSDGSWDQTVGSAKEAIGNAIGSENLRQAGVEQNAAGKEQEAKGQLKDWGEGIQDRAQGHLGAVGAAITGNREEQKKFEDIHDEGKVRQRGAEADMAKRQGV